MPDPSSTTISIAILAGGKNSRFGGSPKALTEWQGETLISRYIRILSPLTEHLFIISNQPHLYHEYPVEVFTDLMKGRGPLSGIHAALSHTVSPHVLVLACDLPFLAPEVAKHLCSLVPDHPEKVLVPFTKAGVEPLFSLWPQRMLTPLEQWLSQASRLRIVDFLNASAQMHLVDVQPVMKNPHAFVNINTPGDLEAAKELPCPQNP